MRYARRLVAVAAVAGLLMAGCTTTGGEAFEGRASEAAQINTQLGIGYMRQGQYDLALDKLKRALKQDSDLPETHVALAELYRRMGETGLAEEHYDEALDLDSGRPQTHNNYGVFLCAQGRYEEAEEHFLEAAGNPDYNTPAMAYANLGVCARRAGNTDEAERYLRKALQMNPRFGDALYPMAKLSFEQGRYLQARAFLQRFHQAAGVTPASLWLAVRTERRLGDTRAAREYARQLRQRFPKSNEAQKLGAGTG